jgi:putative DNA methylase
MGETKKKLIEVALPLEAINKEAAREKSIRHGHPSTLHLWWARRPLAACRAVLFASLVDDPSSHPETFPTEEAQDKERQRLFRLIEELVKWENSNNERVLKAAREEIRKSTGGNPPPVLDPFCGGGSIPLEAQRLGLEAHASDLNPVAVLITKALVEIPPRFAGKPPINPESRKKLDHTKTWHGAQGLAEDVRYYGKWVRDEVKKRIGHLYPLVNLSKEHNGQQATVIAWLWARTIKCPNPACGIEMPLVRSFVLSNKATRKTWIEPQLQRTSKELSFVIKTGASVKATGTVTRHGANCLACGTTVSLDYVRAEAQAGRLGTKLLATVVEGHSGRIYLPANKEDEGLAYSAQPHDPPETNLPERALSFRVQAYGMTKHRQLFTARQLVALTTFCDVVAQLREHIASQKEHEDFSDYATAVATYLAMAVDRTADRGSTICTWDSSPKMEALRNTFARQAIPMTWDFAEGNPFSQSSGNWMNNVEWAAMVVEQLPAISSGTVKQLDATASINGVQHPLVSTDPPYYDNIGYADLSDYFYVWLRRSLSRAYPDLFSTVLVPKAQELIATPYRFDGDKQKARQFFEEGLRQAFSRINQAQSRDYPVAVYYAFKQAEADEDEDGDSNTVSTGWETMLEALLEAGFAINGTWPMRTELSNRPVAAGTNALASSVVLACKPRDKTAPLATRREFVSELKKHLPLALKNLQRGNIAPVDFAQAAIGPGMSVFSRYTKVVEANGTPMLVRTALALINQVLDEVLAEQEGEFDADTRWALTWFEQHGFFEGPFGDAETLSKAKDTSVNGMVQAGIVAAKAGKVRLLKREELPADWNPLTDQRLTVWEITQQLIRRLEEQGEAGAAALLKKVGSLGDTARDLAYRLYNICERKKWAQDAMPYNSLVTAWPEIARLAAAQPDTTAAQAKLGY